MAKKAQKKVEKVKLDDITAVDNAIDSLVEVTLAQIRPQIAPLTSDFGREDLNKLRDTINEIIKRV